MDKLGGSHEGVGSDDFLAVNAAECGREEAEFADEEDLNK